MRPQRNCPRQLLQIETLQGVAHLRRWILSRPIRRLQMYLNPRCMFSELLNKQTHPQPMPVTMVFSPRLRLRPNHRFQPLIVLILAREAKTMLLYFKNAPLARNKALRANLQAFLRLLQRPQRGRNVISTCLEVIESEVVAYYSRILERSIPDSRCNFLTLP